MTQMNLRIIMLSERSQAWKATYFSFCSYDILENAKL